jgi:hypothetical protein
MRYEEKYGITGQATDDIIIWHMRFACWLNKSTDRLRIYNTYFAFHGNLGYVKAPQYYIYIYTASLIV